MIPFPVMTLFLLFLIKIGISIKSLFALIPFGSIVLSTRVKNRTRTKVWCDTVYDTAIAKTAGTFDAVNSNKSEIKIGKKDAKHILGFLINYCVTAQTDAERAPEDLIIRVNSKPLGISSQDVVIPWGSNDADAVTKYIPTVTTYVPWKNPQGIDLFNATIDFKATVSGADSTGGYDVAVGVLYSNNSPSLNFMIELMTRRTKRLSGGAYANDAGKAHGTAGAAVSLSSLTVPNGVFTILGLLGQVMPNGITAGDPVSGIVEFASADINDFSPQIYPLNLFFQAALGTVVQGQVSIPDHNFYYPTRFPLEGVGATITVATTLAVAAGTAPDTTQAVVYE